MKIVQLNSADHYGGGEAHTLVLCRSLVEHEYDVTLVCRPDSVISKKATESGLKTLCLPLFGGFDFYSIIMLANYCRSQRVEIVHAHLGRDYWVTFFIKILIPNIRTVISRHVLFPFGKTFLHRMLLVRLDQIIAVSTAVRNVLVEYGHLSTTRIAVVHNGIDLQHYQVNRQNGNGFRIGILGQISPNKGQHIFIRSIPHVLQALPYAHFLIVGSDFGQGKYTGQLKTLCSELKIEPQVSFYGFSDKVADLLNTLDLLVLCSAKEACPLAPLEAMACGTAVISSDFDGVTDFISQGENGVIVPYGNSDALSEAIVRLLTNDSLRRSLVENGLKSVQHNFELSIMSAKIIKLYKKLVRSA